MSVYIMVGLFLLGTIMGSFYNVVGYRMSIGESIITPPSHCTKCNHRLGPLELIPIISYVIQGGKCKHCKTKISIFYPLFEFMTGLLFLLSYISFGLSPDLIIALTFISMLLIVVLSDYEYLIIEDKVLIFFGLLIILEKFLIGGVSVLLSSLLSGIGAFITMWLIKQLGNFLFKKESMGDGDIKLLTVFGLVLSYPTAIMSVFLASIIGFPIALLMVKKRPNREIPFGPFLAIAAIILLLCHIDLNTILNLYN